jgi:hypothetical protein
MTATEEPIPVRVVGVVRGRDVEAVADLSLDRDALVLEWLHATAWRLELDDIEGIGVGSRSVTVYLRHHDVLDLEGPDALRPFALAVMDRICRLPELTRGLKHFGAPTGGAGGAAGTLHAAHDRWFGPLLAARASVHGVSDPARQIALVDGEALAVAMTDAMASMAAAMAPDHAAEQRALEAAIEDEAAALFAALAHLRAAAVSVHTGELDTRCADWRRWVAALSAVFAAADEAWGAIAEILGES